MLNAFASCAFTRCADNSRGIRRGDGERACVRVTEEAGCAPMLTVGKCAGTTLRSGLARGVRGVRRCC